MKAGVAKGLFLESEFFDGAESMREQLAGTLDSPENGILKQVISPGAYSFFLATAAQVFKQELVFEFLSRLRRWAGEKLNVNHASTPQVHAYGNGQERALAPDSTQASWHYLFSLTRDGEASIRLLAEAEPRRSRLGINLIPVTHLPLKFNQLLVHESRQPYAVVGPKRAAKPADGAILLHGYLW